MPLGNAAIAPVSMMELMFQRIDNEWQIIYRSSSHPGERQSTVDVYNN
jgi:hypothetical protein